MYYITTSYYNMRHQFGGGAPVNYWYSEIQAGENNYGVKVKRNAFNLGVGTNWKLVKLIYVNMEMGVSYTVLKYSREGDCKTCGQHDGFAHIPFIKFGFKYYFPTSGSDTSEEK